MERPRLFETLTRVGTAAVIVVITGCEQAQRKPVGGVWRDAKVSGDHLDESAHAFPTDESDPPVEKVVFTGYWPGAQSPDPNNHDAWPILCEDDAPDPGTDIYRCEADISNLPPGEFTVSFDVYNTEGGSNLAPNGTKTLTHQIEDK